MCVYAVYVCLGLMRVIYGTVIKEFPSNSMPKETVNGVWISPTPETARRAGQDFHTELGRAHLPSRETVHSYCACGQAAPSDPTY